MSALKMALCCFQERYLYGWAILDVEVRRAGRPTREKVGATVPEAGDALSCCVRFCSGA